MIQVRRYSKESDVGPVGLLIADTFSEYNLAFASPEDLPLFLGPYRNARSSETSHLQAIDEVIQADLVLVAEDDGEIVGVLRGRSERLQSLFVAGSHHRRGVGRMLVGRFEQWCSQQGALGIEVAATLYAVPFYTRVGYKKTADVQSGSSFEGSGLPYQPMKKTLAQKP